MTLNIENGDFNLFADIARIQTRCPYEFITDKMVCSQARRNRLPAGEPIIVQCMSHDGCELLARCEYVVTERKPYLRTVGEDTDNPRTGEEFTYEVARVSDWLVLGKSVVGLDQLGGETVEVRGDGYLDDLHNMINAEVSPAVPPAIEHNGEMFRVWNHISRVHEVRQKIDNSLVCVHKDKETANEIAAGKLPIPVAA